MAKCYLCKEEKEHLNKGKEIEICDSCLLEIVTAFSYHIGGKEVTKDEFERQAKRND